MCSIQLVPVYSDNDCERRRGINDLPNRQKLVCTDETRNTSWNKEIDFIDTYSRNSDDRRLCKKEEIAIMDDDYCGVVKGKTIEHLRRGLAQHSIRWFSQENCDEVIKTAPTDLNGNIIGKFTTQLKSRILDFTSGSDGKYYLHGSLPNSVDDIPIQARPKFVEFLRKCRDLLHKYEEN